MSIKYDASTKIFYLVGKGTTYAFFINEYGYAEHLYFGKSIGLDDLRYIRMRGSFSGFATVPGQDGPNGLNSYHHFPTEMAFFGTGDYREAMLLARGEDGFSASEMLYEGHDILDEKPPIKGMPSSRGGETLVLRLRDTRSSMACELYYTVWDDCDTVARRAVYMNTGEAKIVLERAYSFSLSLDERNYDAVSLYGAWSKEGQIERTALHHGSFCIDSKRGASSATVNPFLVIAERNANENFGDVYGISLIYSSSYVLKAEGTSEGRTLITGGINDFGFAWALEGGDSFETPEVLITFSSEGLGGMSRGLHRMLREYVISPEYVMRKRPVVINSWEGTYHDFDVEKLKRIADGIKGTGVDTFVLDDGWFRKYKNSYTSLGDWEVNRDKFPNGLEELIDHVNSIDMSFGLWIEPEMISEDSDLYRAHPDYAIGRLGEAHCYGRHQLMLDLVRDDVRDHIVDKINGLIRQYRITYIKWDYNRNITEAFSYGLPKDRQGEFFHRYVLGVYDLFERIVKANPQVFFECCSSGETGYPTDIPYWIRVRSFASVLSDVHI